MFRQLGPARSPKYSKVRRRESAPGPSHRDARRGSRTRRRQLSAGDDFTSDRGGDAGRRVHRSSRGGPVDRRGAGAHCTRHPAVWSIALSRVGIGCRRRGGALRRAAARHARRTSGLTARGVAHREHQRVEHGRVAKIHCHEARANARLDRNGVARRAAVASPVRHDDGSAARGTRNYPRDDGLQRTGPRDRRRLGK